MKPCAVASCDAPVAAKYVMCREHWQLVPEVLQRMIWRLWNEGRPRPGYREACASAAEQVQDILDERQRAAG